LAAGRSQKFASCRGGWDEGSCPRSATAIHSAVVNRTTNLPLRGGHFTTESMSTPLIRLRHFYMMEKSIIIKLASFFLVIKKKLVKDQKINEKTLLPTV